VYSSNSIGFKNVEAPSVGWSQLVEKYWVSGDPRRSENIRGGSVFVKGEMSAESTDSMEAGCDEVFFHIADLCDDLVLCSLALGVEVEGPMRTRLNEEHRMLVELHGERRNNVGHIIENLVGDVKLNGDFERAFDAK